MRSMKSARIVALVVAIMFLFSSVAMAALPENTVLLGNKAYSFELLNNQDYVEELQTAASNAGDVMYYNIGGEWRHLTSSVSEPAVPVSDIPVNEVEYTDADGNTTTVNLQDSDELEVVSVSAINPTRIEIKFNKAIDGIKAENLYFGLTESEVIDSNIAKLNESVDKSFEENFKLSLSKDKKVVILESQYPDAVIWKDVNTVNTAAALKINKSIDNNELVKNRKAYIQIRDVKVDGKLVDTMEGEFLVKDTTPADFVGVKTNYDDDGKVKGVSVTFTEPVHIVVDENNEHKTKFYLDSRTLNAEDDDYELSEDGKVLTINNSKLDGKHTLEIVGLEDLAGNRVVGDVMTKVFEVKPLEEEDPQAVIPKVISVDQIHDGAFKVRFNTKVTADLTIKNLIADKDVDFKLETEDGIEVKDKDDDDKVVAYDYTIEFANDAVDDDQNKDELHWENVYKTSNKIDRVVEIKNIKSTDGKKAESDYRKVHTFVLDNIAPVVDGDVKVVDGPNGPKIQINFYDGPFNGAMKLGDSISGKVIIKQTIDGETKTVAFEANGLTLTDDGTLEIDLTDDTKFAAFQDDNKKVKPGNYTISLPDGLVVDGAGEPDATPQFKFPQNALVGVTLSFEIEKDKDEGGASVPQTAQGLVSYDEDEKAIVVKFVGEDIDAKTAINPANYTFAGKVLDADTKIEYESSGDIKGDGSNVKGAIVRIYLKDNTVVRDGSYTLTVENVATKSGAKMLPTTVRVDGLKDNTAPLLIKAVVTGDAQIELTFNESITGDYAKAVYNFQVLVGGTPIDIEEVKEKEESDDRILVLHTTSTFDADKYVVKVVTTKDVNGDMFITDIGGNKLAAGTTVTATKLGE